MANSYIQVSPDSTGKKLDTEQVVVGANTVERERVQISGAADTAIAPCDATNGLTTNPSDRALRDNGKVDIAGFDVALPAGSAAIGEVTAVGKAADGAAVTGNPVLVAGQDGTNAQSLKTSTAGYLAVAVGNGVAATDAQSFTGLLHNDGGTSISLGVTPYMFNGASLDRARGDTTNGLDVDVTRLPALVAGSANIGDVDVLTVPAPLSTTGGGTEATALRVTLASDSTGLVSVDDNAGSLTVDLNGGTDALIGRVKLTDGTTVPGVIVGTTALKTDLSSVAGTATVTAAAGVQKVGIVGNANAALDAATGAAPPANAILHAGLGSGATGGFLVAAAYGDSFANINIVTATTTLLITGVSGRHVRIAAFSLITAGANNVAFISGTGATCGTGTTGMTGGTTAATGYNFAANGGIVQGTGIGEINRTNATGDSVCIVTSAAVQLSGRVSYAIY